MTIIGIRHAAGLAALLWVGMANAAEPTLDELLNMQLSDLSKLQVTAASHLSLNADKSPMTIRLIEAEEIRRRGYRSLEQALATLPGLQFRNIQGFNSYTFMRGAPSQNNLILLLVDGLPINELNSGGFYGGAQFNMLNLKRIEVIYGPSSVLHGTNAFSGVINLVTYAPGDTGRSEFSVAAGSFNTRDAAVRSDSFNPVTGVGYSLGAMVNTTEKTELGAAEGDNNWTSGMENFEDNLSLDARVKVRDFEAGLAFQDKRASRTTNYKSIGDVYLDGGSEWHISFLNLWAQHNYRISEQLGLISRLYYRDTTVEDDTIAYVRVGEQGAYYRPNQVWGVDERLQYQRNEANEYILGISWEEERLAEGFSKTFSTSEYLAPATPPSPNMLPNHRTSLYGELRHTLSAGLEFTAGARFDSSSSYGEVTTPRLGLVRSGERYVGKLLYSEAYRAPKPWDFYDGLGNSALQPEEVNSLEGVLLWHFGTNLKSSLSVYNNHITNKLTKESVASSYRWVNQGELNVLGAELEIDYIDGPYTWGMGYSYTDAEDGDGNATDEIAPHMLNLSLDYRHDEKLDMGLNARYIGERENPVVISATASDEVDAAWVLGGNIRYRDIAGWDISLIGDNLLDEVYFDTSNRPPERYRQAERNWRLLAHYTF